MKVNGTATVAAARLEVWTALQDPAMLARAIPGCHQLEQVSPDSYRMTVSVGVAAIKGVYQGDVRLSDQAAPGSYVLHASGAGAPGTVSTDVLVTLTEEGPASTRVDYDADAVVGGMIGGVGQRVLAGVAKKTAGEFFKAVNVELTSPQSAQPASAMAASDGSPHADASAVGAAPATYPGHAEAPGFVAGVAVGAGVGIASLVVGWVLGRSGRR